MLRYHRLLQRLVHIVTSLKTAATLLQQRARERESLQRQLGLLSGVPSRHCQFTSSLGRRTGRVCYHLSRACSVSPHPSLTLSKRFLDEYE